MSQAIVERVRAGFPTPLGPTHGEFLLAVARALGLHLFRKSGGTVVTLPDGVTVSQDVLVSLDGQAWDILRDGEGAADPVWNEYPRDPAFDFSRIYKVTAGGDTEPAPRPDPLPGFPAFDQDVRASLGRIEQALQALQHKPTTVAVPPPVAIAPPVQVAPVPVDPPRLPAGAVDIGDLIKIAATVAGIFQTRKTT